MGEWWKEGVVYQIYPRSFQDSNGDGIGDIPGIISRLDAIRDLGAGIIWLSPVYKSPDADNGYDISDYYSINPQFGSLSDMDALFAEARKRGIRIIMDLVVNHTSDEHEWFQKSRRGDPEYRDFYIWKPPRGNGKTARGLPNNWTSYFQGPAWEFDELRGEYYLHLFDKKQPDLNYRNPAVIGEVKKILRFWLDRGASGFRCDVINVLYKSSFGDGRPGPVRGMEHYLTQEGTHRILREFRADVLSRYDCFTVGETSFATLKDAGDLSGPDRGELDMVFYFDHLEVDRLIAKYVPLPFSAKKLLSRLTRWQQGLDWNALYLENHDQPRIVSHYGDDGAFWERSAKLLGLMEFTLRGTPYIYQGQEIGMTNFDFKGMDDLNDVESRNMDALLRGKCVPAPLRWYWIRTASRDNARTPMQWSAEDGAGFTAPGVKPWLGINANHRRINYGAQRNDPSSVLAWYRRLIALRAGSNTLKYGPFAPVYGDSRVMAYRRDPAEDAGDGPYTVILNLSGRGAKLPRRILASAGGAKIVLSTTGRTEISGRLEPWEGLLLSQH
ncbi:MAG: alpha-glucosidase [Spirochaetaceae bacterium]|jgi:oligo-1,6-glucosidase|nr:alpha-glucosidase [Spirochaetaceae bacterium]